MAELELFVRDWLSISIVAAMLWVIVVGSLKAHARRKAVRR